MARQKIKYEECLECTEKKLESQFYKAGRGKTRTYHICKTCVLEKAKSLEYVQSTLKDMDIVFIKSLWEKTSYKYKDMAFDQYLTEISANIKYRDLPYKASKFEDDSDGTDMVYNEIWRGSFSIRDIDYLEKYYNDLHRDYRITTTNHKDYAKKIAKASLAMDKAYERMLYDRKDTSAAREFKELKGIFDDLCKSAQFSESTRSANDVGLGSFGVIFNLIENNEWIPEHKPLNKDLYDKLLDQFSNISKSL